MKQHLHHFRYGCSQMPFQGTCQCLKSLWYVGSFEQQLTLNWLSLRVCFTLPGQTCEEPKGAFTHSRIIPDHRSGCTYTVMITDDPGVMTQDGPCCDP